MPITQQEIMNRFGGMYGKTIPQLETLAKYHWKEWRPKQYEELRRSGDLREELRKAAKKAHKEIMKLLQSGYQNHEAEEIVLTRYILLAPEQEVLDEMERMAEMEDGEDEEM